MTEELKQTIEKEIAALPQKGREAIATVDWLKIAEDIGKKNALEQEEIEDFQLETLLVLVGVTDPEFYAINIENHVNIITEKATALANEAFEKIFTPIRNVLGEEYMNTEELGDIVATHDARASILPEGIQKIVNDSDYQATLYIIAKRHKLNVEQMGKLEAAVTNLIVGSIRPDDFGDLVEDNLNIKKEKSKELVKDITEEIFRPLREKMVASTKRDSPMIKKTLNDFQQPARPTMPASATTTTVPLVSKDDMDVLSDHGIEIIHADSTGQTKKAEPKMEPKKEEKVEIKKEIEKVIIPAPVLDKLELPAPEEIKKVEIPPVIVPKPLPIFAQKLAGSFQMPTTMTDHTGESIAKEGSDRIKQSPKVYPPKGDPYRLSPDE